MIISEPFMTAALAFLTALAAFALTVAVVTYGTFVGVAIFSAGLLVGWLLPRPPRRQ